MKITEIAPKPKAPKKLRVAAYARVSSEKDAAFHSLEAQEDYYRGYVAAHPDCELVAVFSDNGISGTVTERPAFQEMLEACRNGKIDMVITKSITRFARNTVTLLETVRELKALGIDAYFEKEQMHSLSADGELLLTLLAMYAEEEARSASENQKWRIQKLYQQGLPASGHTFGYRLEDGHYEIVPEEAEVAVRLDGGVYLVAGQCHKILGGEFRCHCRHIFGVTVVQTEDDFITGVGIYAGANVNRQLVAILVCQRQSDTQTSRLS